MSCSRYLISVIFTFCLYPYVFPSCVFLDGKYDLSPIDVPNGWIVPDSNVNDTLSHYKISICQALNSSNTGCTNSAVCKTTGNVSISFGNAVESSKNYEIAAHTQNGFSIYLLTKSECSGKGYFRSTINFACGLNLGVPELTLQNECQANFFWKTSAACPTKPKNSQVPCYVVDENGEKRDLSHLIKQTGGYFVNTFSPFSDFVINVCSDVIQDNSTKNCPTNSAACQITGSETLSFGELQDGLQYTSEGLLLTYRTSVRPAGCKLEPKTTILFKCPERGMSQPPKVISNSFCQYEIEWATSFACPESSLKSDFKTCSFNTETHGVEIDLSSLKGNANYVIQSSFSNTTSFVMNICSGLKNFSCGTSSWRHISVCMIDAKNHTATIVGTTLGKKFMYADDEVILTYPKGSSCEGGLEHSTVIHFICDEQSDDDAIPQHIYSYGCVHYFEFPTKHACLLHPLDTPCSVTYKNKKINLQKLILADGEAWEAVDQRGPSLRNGSEYYINVCGQVSHLGNLSSCGDGSSVCVLHSDGTYLNVGNFTSPPSYDIVSDSVRLQYTGGSRCSAGKLWESTIDFVCRPGLINSVPVLIRVDESSCSYAFEWHTAEACPEGLIEGTDCKVYDDNLDISYDLNALKSKTYRVDTNQYQFYMGVCESIKDSPCSENRNSSDNVGVCQVDTKNKYSWKTGEPSSNLSYTDGVVNLTYLSGDPYNNSDKTPRMTIIIFICDFKAGNGNPVFAEEVNFSYIFHWYTNLVCPPSALATECLAHDPASHLIYDLSSLSMTRNSWSTIASDEDDSGKEKRIYLNVCRPVNRLPVCAANAAACVVEVTESGEKKIISNLGQSVGPPVLEGAGHLSLVYTNGDPCTEFGKHVNYSTVIHFLCGDQLTRSGPMFLHKVGACEYMFLWTTKAACPTGNLETINHCQLTDPDSGFNFDLSSLQMKKQPYRVESSEGVFQFNVCGRIVEGCSNSSGEYPSQNVSVCKVDKDDNLISNIAVADSYKLSYSVGQDLTITYDSNSDQKVIIRFPCYNGSGDPKPKLLRHENKRFEFEMKTHLACIPRSLECNIMDSKGNAFDLTPLAKFNGGNWEVSDFRPYNTHQRYHVNFCRPLNKIESYRCPGGSSSACQTNTLESGSSGFDLGSQFSAPVVSDKGTVVIRYTNGSFCHNGQFQRSTTINLFCSQDRGDLIFIGETPECEYVFSMETPAACPIRTSNGTNCIVKDPVFGYIFDLNPLRSKNNNYSISVGEYDYSFNVCDKLNNFNNNCAGSAACQTKHEDSTFSKSLGLPSDSLMYQDGVISLYYKLGTGDCHGQYNRSTILTFTCHHEKNDKDGPKFISEIDNCTYIFEWPTVHACPPFDVIECSVTDDDGTHYDFSKLSLPDTNYYVENPFNPNKTFVINLCRSVIHTPSSLCPYTSAACLIDSSNAGTPANLGRVSKTPYIDHGKIRINYTSGDPCKEWRGPFPGFWQTVIDFTCDQGNINSKPEFVGKDDCTYFFDWPTAYACRTKPVQNTNDCTARDPLSGHVYNFTSMKNHGFFKSVHGQHQYYFSICGSNNSSPCGNNTGACQEEINGQKRSWKIGAPSTSLEFNDGVLFLNYSNGDFCHNGKFRRNAVVQFRCGRGIGSPSFLSEADDCTYHFDWPTELACRAAVHCTIQNGIRTIDLSPLAQSYHTASSSIVNDEGSYFISVCGSLPRDYSKGLLCPAGTGICRVSNSHGSAVYYEDLGRIEVAPFMDFMGHATLIYTNGSTCVTNHNETNKARILFLCDSEAGMGQPVLVDVQEEICLHIFEWHTSLVCEKAPTQDAVLSCNYTDRNRGVHFDLTPLQNSPVPYKVPYKSGGGDFLLSVCSSLKSQNISRCEDSGTCLLQGNVTHSYGKALTQQFSFDGHRLRLSLRSGDDCPSGEDGKLTSEIFFVCDDSAGSGKPILHKKYTCLIVFLWKTSFVCQNMQRQCSFVANNHHYDFNLLSSLSHNWNTSFEQNKYWINLCRGVQRNPTTQGCDQTSAVCMQMGNEQYISLGTVQSMQTSSINSTDLLLTFQSGDRRACASVPSGQTLTPTTRLFMRCGMSLGNPRIFSPPDTKCFYDFIWESSLACPDRAEQVMLEKGGIITDERFGYSVNISSILNSTFNVTGQSGSDNYIYQINLSGQLGYPIRNPCSQAAICQTKPHSRFFRDIGSGDSRIFIIRGSELHLTFVSRTKPCGKNPSKNVTTIINMQCKSAAGMGKPVFLYETGDCDYLFEWETVAICPDIHKLRPGDDGRDVHPNPDPYREEVASSGHTPEIVVGVIVAVVILAVILFTVTKPERRQRVSHRFRSLFGNVSLPYFRYKRSNGERLILVDAAEPSPFDDARDVEMLT